VRNSSLVKCLCAENEAGLKSVTEAADLGPLDRGGRGASHEHRRQVVRPVGASGSENAGMSSEKKGGNPFRRKPKVS
jgi:hypothetical protein